MFDRLVGLETEYAIRFRPDDPAAQRPTDYELYRQFLGVLKRRVPTAPAEHWKEGVFTGYGGAIWFERVYYAGGTGLIEGATPECRGPRQVLLYQRAQDRLFADACRDLDAPGELTLIKNDRDSRRHVYGAQENYELSIGRSWDLWFWRAGVLLLLPAAVFTWAGHILLLIAYILYLMAAGLVYLGLRAFLTPGRRRQVLVALVGADIADDQEKGAPLPRWSEGPLVWGERLLLAPLAMGMLLLARVTAFRRTRRLLLPFLVSRPLIAGSGMLDEKGRFHLSDKAGAINCLLGYGGLLGDRPLFSLGHLLKQLAFKFWIPVRDVLELLGERQRLQICVGDSNMAEEAEYLRVGTTLLVLDAIEAGALDDAPRVRRPIRSLRRIVADPELLAAVPLSDGSCRIALQLQRFYLEACRRHVESSAGASEEACDVLARWEAVLGGLEADRQRLVGRLDWVTKRYLIETTGSAAGEPARRKIDLRYHELSPDGYFAQLQAAGVGGSILEDGEIERAMSTPPAGTPASDRGRYVQEFSGEPPRAKVSWTRVRIGKGLRPRVISLRPESRL